MTCDEYCLSRVDAVIRVPRAGAPPRVFRSTSLSSVQRPGRRLQRFSYLPGAAPDAVRQALAAGRRVTAELRVTTVDAAGNATRTFRLIRLAR